MNEKPDRAGSGRKGLHGTLLGAAVVAVLLGVTACQPSEGDGKAAAPSNSASTGGNKSTASSGDTGTGTASSSAADEQTGDSGETGGGNGTTFQDCKVTDLRTGVELQDSSGETPRHFLLTVTNGNKTPCVLNKAPQVRLGAGNNAPIVKSLEEPDTEPLVVEGGGKAYAGLYIFGNDEGGEAEYDQADRFTATLVAGEGTELSGTLLFDLPDGLDSVSYDDAARVNGWAGTEGLAMRPINQL
ncbi:MULTISPECIES: DUF4232 domain-containing protein [unclassified Streptomyces]|uniref:DUF4232 domain-containing protein n=1 Tax=unclassified Streptomyces TaxID=2593676 RepID=UPI002E807B81|nr:DUF4232 domain-containing protein [Streptomyces sp. NBC_00589]WTI42175.1 DUF4232 domain-containing protein [Streptomyces sp. NBC_00775]WUB24143.1 DUF4232 domain-containing protein [Streptomyces sp. NBC_00589]